MAFNGTVLTTKFKDLYAYPAQKLFRFAECLI